MDQSALRKLMLKAAGVAISVIPASSCILLYFPIWRERGAATVLSGFVLLVIALSAVPLFKILKRALASPSAPLMWFIIFILFFMLSRIADEMTVIAFVGFLSNALGAIIFRLADGTVKKNEDGR